MVMDVNQTYCGDHFTIHTNIESLCCTLETIKLYVNYTSVKNENKNKVEEKLKKREEGENVHSLDSVYGFQQDMHMGKLVKMDTLSITQFIV